MKINANSLVLVAVMNNPRDLEIARILGWYRVPLKTAPKVVQVDYLAFYFTAGFNQERWGIHWIAPVQGHELVKRSELFTEEEDHPRADDLYYKIQLGSLIKLPEPIRAEKWKRITFFYTTGKYLNDAKTIKELIVQSDERNVLWQALRERSTGITPYQKLNNLPEDIPPELISVLLGLKFDDHE